MDLLAVQGTLKSLLQHHSSKASILQHSAFFIVQLSHPYMTTGKTIALTRQTFVGKVMKGKSLSRVRLFATPWTVAHQASPSMGFSRQEYWSGLSFPSPGDLLHPGIEPRSLALQADALPSEPQGIAKVSVAVCIHTHTHTHIYTCVQDKGIVSSKCCCLCKRWCCCCSLVSQLSPMDCNTPGLPVPHHLLKIAQDYVHCIGSAIQASPPLMPFYSTSGTFPVSQLFTSDDQNTRVSASASVLSMNIQD